MYRDSTSLSSNNDSYTVYSCVYTEDVVAITVAALHTTQLNDNNQQRQQNNKTQFSTKSQRRSRVISGVFTLPEQMPYVARAPAQQKQNPGGFVSALAEYLQSINQSINQPINQPTNPPTHPPTHQPINQIKSKNYWKSAT